MLEVDFGARWLPALIKALRASRGERAREVSALGDLFGDPRELARFYVEPDCQERNPSTDEDVDFAADVRQNAFSYLEQYMNACAHHQDGRRAIFVLADSGMGKTSLLVMLKLMHIHKFWPSDLKVELIKLGPATTDAISRLKDRSNTVLLLDSLDEDRTAIGNTTERLEELLSLTQNFKSVIVTCRTQYFPLVPESPEQIGRVRIGGWTSKVVYLAPFNDAQVLRYLRKRFHDPWWRLFGRDGAKKLERARRLLAHLGTLRMRPMLLAYIDDLVESELAEKRDLTIFDVYCELVDRWLLKEVRLRRAPSTDVLNAATLAVARELDATNERTLAPDKLRELADKNPHVAAIGHLDVGGRSLLNVTASGHYRFAHYSLQEFVLARDIVVRSFEAADPGATSCRASTELLRFIVLGARGSAKKARPVVRNVEFRHAGYTGGDLAELTFDRCDFSGARFLRTTLRGARLSACKFVTADLEDANLENVIFSASTLERANLRGAQLGGADLREALLDGAVMENAVCDENTKWPDGFPFRERGVQIKPRTPEKTAPTAEQERPRGEATFAPGSVRRTEIM